MSREYDVFKLHSIRPKSESHKHECCAAVGENVYIGTSEGSILMYVVTQKNESEWASSGKCIVKTKYSKAVQQLVPLPDMGILLVRTNGYILTYGLADLQEVGDRNFELPVRECATFAVKLERGRYIVAAICRKKIVLLENKESGEFAFLREMTIPEGAKTCNWAARGLVVGFKKEFVLVDSVAATITSLFETGRLQTPLVSNMCPMNELVVAQESIGVRVRHDGAPSGNKSLAWGSMPSFVGYIHPYIVSVHEGNTVEVRCPFLPDSSQRIIAQTILLKYASQLSISSLANFDLTKPTVSSNPFESRRDCIVCITTVNSIHLLEFVPIADQVSTLCNEKSFDEALELCRLCPNEVSLQQVNDVKIQYGLHYFAQKRYAQAIAKFQDGNADPRFVVSLIPGYFPAFIEAQWKAPAVRKAYKLEARDFALLTPSERTDMFTTLYTYLQQLSQQRRAMVRPVAAAAAAAAAVGTLGGAPQATNASVEVTGEIAVTAASLNDAMIDATIDTALLRTLIELRREADAVAFLQKPNACAVDDCEEFLRSRDEYVALAALWATRGMISKSLEMLRLLGLHGSCERGLPQRTKLAGTPAADFLPALIQREGGMPRTLATQRAILELVGSDVPEAQAGVFGRQLVGIVTSMQLLKKLNFDDDFEKGLFYDHSAWILSNVDTAYSMDMFTPFLKVIDPHEAVRHLERLVDGIILTIELVARFIEIILGPSCNALEDVELHNKRAYALVALLKHDRKRAAAQTSLLRFLERSKFYEPQVVVTWLNTSPISRALTRERAQVYRVMKDHSAAIDMFVNESGSLEDAKKYATTVSAEEGDAFKILLQYLLKPTPSSKQGRLREALQVVNESAGVDARTALPMLPPETPLADLKDFIVRSLRDASARGRGKELHSNVLRSLERQTQATLARHRAQCTAVLADTKCAKCGKRVRDTVFARYPNAVIVHQACLESEFVCPQTHRDFRIRLDLD